MGSKFIVYVSDCLDKSIALGTVSDVVKHMESKEFSGPSVFVRGSVVVHVKPNKSSLAFWVDKLP